MHAPAASGSLSRRERLGLWLFLAVVVLFGALTVWRGALMNTRKGDQEIYFQTAYAARVGDNIYDVEDSHGWHWVYPPLFAVLLIPLAERPPHHPVDLWTLPFGVSVGLWYAISVACLCLAVHSMASAVEQVSEKHHSGKTVRPGSRRWWALRIIPVLVGLPAIGQTLMRGQVNLLLLALIAGMIAAILRQRPWRAGILLGTAIAIKLIPAFLVIYPLWRRDLRCLAATVLGVLVAGLLIPMAVLGPQLTVTSYEALVDHLILPGFGQNENRTRHNELLAMNATHSQCFQAAIHGTMHRGDRPAEAAPGVRLAHWLIAGLLTAATLWAGGWRKSKSPTDSLLLLGCLALLMILSSPICHQHYFVQCVPLVMGLLAAQWEDRKSLRVGWGLIVLLTLFTLTFAILYLPRMELACSLALGIYPSLLLLGAGGRALYLRRKQCGKQSEASGVHLLAA